MHVTGNIFKSTNRRAERTNIWSSRVSSVSLWATCQPFAYCQFGTFPYTCLKMAYHLQTVEHNRLNLGLKNTRNIYGYLWPRSVVFHWKAVTHTVSITRKRLVLQRRSDFLDWRRLVITYIYIYLWCYSAQCKSGLIWKWPVTSEW